MKCRLCGKKNKADALKCKNCGAGLVKTTPKEPTANSTYLQAYAETAEAEPFEVAAALKEQNGQPDAPPPPTGKPVDIKRRSSALPSSKDVYKKTLRDTFKIEGAGIAAPGIYFLRMWWEDRTKFERRSKILTVLIKAILPFILALMTLGNPLRAFSPQPYNATAPIIMYIAMLIGLILTTVLYYLLILALIRFIQWRLTKSVGYARKKRAFNVFQPFILLSEKKIYASNNDTVKTAYRNYQAYYEEEQASAAEINKARKVKARQTAEKHARVVAEREKRQLEDAIAGTRANIESTEHDYRGYYKHKGTFTEDFYRNPNGFFEKERYEDLKKREKELAEEYEKKYGTPPS